MRIEILLDVKTTLGEGPLRDAGQERLHFIDSFDGRVFRTTVGGGELRAWDVSGKIGSTALRKDGNGAVVSLQTGFHALDCSSGDCDLIPEPDQPANRINDGRVDRRGRFLAGSMEEGSFGVLVRLDPDFAVTTIDTGIIWSNSACFSPDDRTFYFCDTWGGQIRA
jgi:L-arabinonolactonase